MGTVTGTFPLPVDQAASALTAAATQAGWVVDVHARHAGVLRLVKSVTAFSWGSQITVGFTPLGPTTTQTALTSTETLAITDWGRGKRAARRLLTAAGAVPD
ncbi:hypothetical protein IC607_04160 [Cellulomonas sp. JH27-2]|uniref:hypothetical protein n=1 Tax=Cellulomonas sp. JH27-2 TaxID=2774139 RepID=UPI00177B32E4|nr:hypothetical protein [Cellulomonas sp. JH27-2]MBD8058161.1 hypothetical protein [Cellulomonas sp. JH27-2]